MNDKVTLTITRDDLAAYHRAIDVAINHLDEARGSEGRVTCAERLVRLKKSALDAIWDHDDVRLKKSALDAIWDHDDVPASERHYG